MVQTVVGASMKMAIRPGSEADRQRRFYDIPASAFARPGAHSATAERRGPFAVA